MDYNLCRMGWTPMSKSIIIISTILQFQGGEKLGKESSQQEQVPGQGHTFFNHVLELLQDAEPWRVSYASIYMNTMISLCIKVSRQSHLTNVKEPLLCIQKACLRRLRRISCMASRSQFGRRQIWQHLNYSE